MFEFRWNFAYHANDTSVFAFTARSRRTPSMSWPPTSVAVSHSNLSLGVVGSWPFPPPEVVWHGQGQRGRRGLLLGFLPQRVEGGGCTEPCGTTRTGVASAIRDRKHSEADEQTRKGPKRKRHPKPRWKKARQRRSTMETVMRCLSQAGDGKDPVAQITFERDTAKEPWQGSPERRPPVLPLHPESRQRR